MRLLLCLQGVALLQLLHTYASVIQAHAVAAPQDTSTNFRNQPSLAVPPPNKRAWPDHRHTFFVVGQTVGLAWRLRFNVLEYARPLGGSSTVPANDLTMFYRATLAVARALWAPEEPQTLRTAIGNGLLLVFWSEQPIEWSFINAFMEHIVSLHVLFVLRCIPNAFLLYTPSRKRTEIHSSPSLSLFRSLFVVLNVNHPLLR